MEGGVPPVAGLPCARSGTRERDTTTSGTPRRAADAPPSGSAAPTSSLAVEPRPAALAAADAERSDDAQQRRAVTITAQTIPARLAWSPDPAWAAGSGGSTANDPSTTLVARQSDASRKRARQGRAKKAARKAAPAEERAARQHQPNHAPEALGHPLAGDVWWQQRPASHESDEPFSECECSDLEQYYDSDDDWADSEVEEDIEEQAEGAIELQTAPLRLHQPRSIMDQSLSDLQDAPPVFPTPRRPDATDLERHRSLTESIESLIHKSEQKDLINSAAKEVFDRFNHGEDGRISQLEFCTLVQNFGVGMDLSAPRLWELCAPTLGPTTAATAGRQQRPTQADLGSTRLSLREFQSFYRKWLSTPELRAKLTRRLRRGSISASRGVTPAAAAGAAAERRCRLQTNRPSLSTDNCDAVVDIENAVDIDTDDGLEASIDEMIELPEPGMGLQSMGDGVRVPFQLAIAMHPSNTAAVAIAAQSSHVGRSNDTGAGGQRAASSSNTAEESLVIELLRGCERLEQEKAEMNRRLDEMLVDHDSMERRVFEVELEKRGLTTLLEKEAQAKQHAEEALKTRENQWLGIGTDSLSDSDLDELLAQLESSVKKVRADQDSRRIRRRESLARDLTCPITGDILKDPVVATDGHTYERAAIERWLTDHQTSPLTNAPLASKQLVPNLRLRAIAEEAKKAELIKKGATDVLPSSVSNCS